MTNELKIFENPEFGQVRTVTIDGEPWFVGKDVAVALGYAEPRSAVSKKVEAEDRGVAEMETPSGVQTMTIINESGLYSLIMSSKLPSAKRFKHWVTSEVLPALRKTGSYSLAPQRELTKDDYIKAASMVSTCRNERLPYVLGFLEQAGFKIPEVEETQEEQTLCTGNNGDTLVKLLEESGKSLNELSRLTNICKSALSYYRRGIYKPSPERYAIIVEALS